MCIIMPNFAPLGQAILEIWPFFIFRDGGRRHFAGSMVMSTLDLLAIVFVLLRDRWCTHAKNDSIFSNKKGESISAICR